MFACVVYWCESAQPNIGYGDFYSPLKCKLNICSFHMSCLYIIIYHIYRLTIHNCSSDACLLFCLMNSYVRLYGYRIHFHS